MGSYQIYLKHLSKSVVPLVLLVRAYILQDYGNKLPVVLLKFEVISRHSSPDYQKYYDCGSAALSAENTLSDLTLSTALCVLLRIAPLTELNFKMSAL